MGRSVRRFTSSTALVPARLIISIVSRAGLSSSGLSAPGLTSPSSTTSRDWVVESFPLERPAMRTRRRDALVPEPSLAYFIAGEENRLAAFVCRSDPSFLRGTNPILLVGPTGAGKTVLALHLASKLGLDAANDSESLEAEKTWQGYWIASELARRYAEAIEADDIEPFRRMIDEASVLVVDDLHSMSDKPAAQEELAMRITARLDAGRPTVLTCRRLPSDIRGMRPSLVSRSLPGLTIPVNLPSPSTRRLMLRELALAVDLDVEDDLLDLLSLGLGDDISARQMLASVKQLALWCRMNDTAVTSRAIQSILDQVNESRSVSISEITQRVARHFRLRSSDLRSNSRRQNVVRARSLAMLLARRVTTLSLNQIGAEFGNRDHTTVLHAIRKTESLLETDADLRRAAAEVTEKLS